MQWRTPLSVASGNGGYAHELQSINKFPFSALGAVFLKGTTLRACAGNPGERIVEVTGGMINSVGLENPGVEAVIQYHLPKLEKLPEHLHCIANVCGSTIEEYAIVCHAFDQTSLSAIEVNISCPNVKRGGALFGNYPDLSAEVVASCRSQTTKPLIVKLSPNQSDIALTAEKCIAAGADALAAINTVSAMAIDVESRSPILGRNRGGMSGTAIFPLALLKVHEVWQVARRHNVPIIAQGGIRSAEDVIAFFLAGASACAMGTALASDTTLPKRVHTRLRDWLAKHGIANISELTGQLRTG